MQIRSPAPLAVRLETMAGAGLVPVVTALHLEMTRPVRTGADPAEPGQPVLAGGPVAPMLELEMPASLALLDLLVPSMGGGPALSVLIAPAAGGVASRITGARPARLTLDLGETGAPRLGVRLRGPPAEPETVAAFGPADTSPQITLGDVGLWIDGVALAPLRRCRLTLAARLHSQTAPDRPAPVAWLGGGVTLTLGFEPGVTAATLAGRLALAGTVSVILDLGRAGAGRRLVLPPGLISANGFDGTAVALELTAAAPPVCTEF